MKTTFGFIFAVLSITALAQDKVTSPKNEQVAVDPSQPLFIVDGIPVSRTEFGLLDRDNIAKMEVMREKEAMTLFGELYGDAARNGAVIVTTKKSQQERSAKPR
jgi:hypothetical protein